MNILFSEKEMGESCYMKTSQSSKPGLPAEKVELLEGIITSVPHTCTLFYIECIELKARKRKCKYDSEEVHTKVY